MKREKIMREIENNANEVEWDPLDITFTLIVDFLAAISFCMSVTEGGIKSVVVLFSITYLYTFYNERKSYSGNKSMDIERRLVNWGCIISIVLLLACVSVGIGFADIDVQNCSGKAKVVLSSGQESILCWDSIGITYLLLIVFFYPSFIHIALSVTKYLRIKKVDVVQLKQYIKKKWYWEVLITFAGIILGLLVCIGKYFYNLYFDKMFYPGVPQFHKYGILFAFLGLLVGWWTQGRRYIKKNSEIEE